MLRKLSSVTLQINIIFRTRLILCFSCLNDTKNARIRTSKTKKLKQTILIYYFKQYVMFISQSILMYVMNTKTAFCKNTKISLYTFFFLWKIISCTRGLQEQDEKVMKWYFFYFLHISFFRHSFLCLFSFA